MSAERTRSCDSRTALSPRPTMLNTTLPGGDVHLHVDRPASTPSNATVETRATMSAPPGLPIVEHLQNIKPRAQAES